MTKEFESDNHFMKKFKEIEKEFQKGIHKEYWKGEQKKYQLILDYIKNFLKSLNGDQTYHVIESENDIYILYEKLNKEQLVDFEKRLTLVDVEKPYGVAFLIEALIKELNRTWRLLEEL